MTDDDNGCGGRQGVEVWCAAGHRDWWIIFTEVAAVTDARLAIDGRSDV